MGSIFLSHNSADKAFVERLAVDIRHFGHYAWVDTAEIKLGDSLIEKIEEGIEKTDFLGVVLSSNSVNSEWVHREVRSALTQEISGRKVKVLPILLEKVDIPLFLIDKKYADFTEETNYDSGLRLILERLSESDSGIGKAGFYEETQGYEGRRGYGKKNPADDTNTGHGRESVVNVNIINTNEGIVAGNGVKINHLHMG